jgi:hypothetical protein|tara:strand:- start:165 stop:374 length:210 start_codon:yes stop_codon:yes gene_type:complete
MTNENVAMPSMNTTAVAGAGNDKDTVVVKKKKKKDQYPGYEEVVAVDMRLKDQSKPRLLKRFRKFAEEK